MQMRVDLNERCKVLTLSIEALTDLCTKAHTKDETNQVLDLMKDLALWCYKYDAKYTAYSEMRMNCLGHDGDEDALYNDEELIKKLAGAVRNIRRDYRESRRMMHNNKNYVELAHKHEAALRDIEVVLENITSHVHKLIKFIRKREEAAPQTKINALFGQWSSAIEDCSFIDCDLMPLAFLGRMESGKTSLFKRVLNYSGTISSNNDSRSSVMGVIKDIIGAPKMRNELDIADFFWRNNYENSTISNLFGLLHEFKTMEEVRSVKGRKAAFDDVFANKTEFQDTVGKLYSYMVDNRIETREDGIYPVQKGRKPKEESERCKRATYYFLALCELLLDSLRNLIGNFLSVWQVVYDILPQGFVFEYKQANNHRRIVSEADTMTHGSCGLFRRIKSHVYSWIKSSLPDIKLASV